MSVPSASGREKCSCLPGQQRGDDSQDHSHDGQPDSGSQPGGGLPGGRHGAGAICGVNYGVSDPADIEDRQRSGR
jgi:hypothetical protein